MPSIHEVLYNNIALGESILDIGCGIKEKSNPFLKTNKITTIDAWKDVNPDILIDLEKEDLPFDSYDFDNILMIDFIEHLDKNRGFEILNQAKEICNKKIFLLTPLIWSDNLINVNNPHLWCYGNQYDAHKSLWSVDDFKDFESIDFPGYFFGIWRKSL